MRKAAAGCGNVWFRGRAGTVATIALLCLACTAFATAASAVTPSPPPGAPAVESAPSSLVGLNPQSPDRARFCVLRPPSGDVVVSNAGQPSGPDWVFATGGGYFFSPSRSAICDVLIGRTTLA